MEQSNLLVSKVLGVVTVEDATGIHPSVGSATFINVNRQTLTINLGSVEDFRKATAITEGVKGVVWNEDGVTLINSDRHTIIKYEPTIHPLAKLFFEEASRYGDTWEGLFKPVKFKKVDLLKFLRQLEVYGGSPEMVEAVKNMKLRESRQESDTVDLESDTTREVVEDTFSMSIPKKFTLNIPLTPEYIGKFQFEVSAERPSDRSRNDGPGNKVIVLTCVNPIEIKRDCMQTVLKEAIPQEIPRLYGKMDIRRSDR